MNYRTISFLSYTIFTDNLKNIQLENKLIINTINPHSYVLAERDVIFKKALQNSDILLPDGVGITKAVSILQGKKIKKIAGMNIHEYLLKKANQKSLKCFYLGSSNYTLSKIKDKVNNEFPNIEVCSYSPPFRDKFTYAENRLMLDKINSCQPEILFIGMTAPKQEKWVFENREKINASIICSIGAVFDFYAETIKRPSDFWIQLGLEGMVRLAKEPRRLWRRFVFSDLRFMFYVFYLKVLNQIKIK